MGTTPHLQPDSTARGDTLRPFRPHADPPNLDGIPAELRERPQWVAWRFVVRDGDGKPTKVPYAPAAGRRASSTEPQDWTDLHGAERYRDVAGLDGIGFVFCADDPYAGVDLDHCRDPGTGAIEPWAQEIIDQLDSYTEVSPSGTGAHIIVRGSLPSGRRRKGHVEMYDSGRYFTVTGCHLPGTPTTINDRSEALASLYARVFPGASDERANGHMASVAGTVSDEDVLQLARRAANGSKFEELWRGDTSGYASPSEADLALCSRLAFYCGPGGESQVDRLFRQSGLYREKWDQRHGNQTYGELTIRKAFEGCTDYYRRGAEVSSANQANSANEVAPWEAPIPFFRHELPPFPTHVLPGWQRDFVEALAEETQTPPDLVANLVISTTALAVARKAEVEVRAGWKEPLNIWTATVLGSGERKSTVFTQVTRIVEEFEEEESRRLGPAIAEAQSRIKIMEQKLNDAQRQAARAELHEQSEAGAEADRLARELAMMQVPVHPKLIVDDCSPERLATLMCDNGGRLAVMSPEGDVFDLMAGRYSRDGAPQLGNYLKGHAGDTIRVNRVSRPADYISRPALTIGLAVQPEVLRGLASRPGFRGRGLLARFLYALPLSLLGRRKTETKPVQREVWDRYAQGMRRLLDLPTGTDTEGSPAPPVLRFDPEGQAVIKAFAAATEPLLGSGGDLEIIADWGGKLAGAVVRLAGLLHLAKHAFEGAPWEHRIGKGAAEGAVELGRYYMAHAKGAFAEMGADPAIEDARAILAWIKRKDTTNFTKREAFEGTKGRFKRVSAMARPLELLSEHCYVREAPREDRSGPGRPPSPVYELNPLLSSQYSHNSHNWQPPPISANSANSANSGFQQREEDRPAEDMEVL